MTQEDLEITHCEGCGVKLQTIDTAKLGFIPEQALNREPIICQRCFRIKHYNEVSSTALHQDDFLQILGHIGNTQSLVVHIVDIFDFEGSLIGSLPRFIGTNPLLLVVNKIDLLPKVSNLNKIVNWVQRQLKEQGLRPVEIVMVSAKKNIGFERFMQTLDKHRAGKDIYVVGATNVGKSTLINRLIRDYSDLEAELTTSQYPGTTLDIVKIPLDDGKFIFDTPGIVYKHRLSELVAKRDIQALLPNEAIKPMVFQLNEQQTLFFGALARFDFIHGERQSFTCYVSSAIKIHRTKLEKADELYAEHRGEMLKPPSKEDLESLPPLTKHPVHIRKGSNVDVLISGLGWIKINSLAGAELEVHVPKGVKLSIRESLI
ncbi:MAG: ribosome biogenesis GTPase YqeH [Paenibacillaceae bacterium]